MYDLPNSIPICGQEFQILFINTELHENDFMPTALGTVNYSTRQIKICGCNREQIWLTLAHEYSHAMLWLMGRYDDYQNESLVQAIAVSIVQMLRCTFGKAPSV